MNKKEPNNMEKQSWVSKHVDTFLIIGSIASALIWNNSQFNELTKDIYLVKQDVSQVKIELTKEISQVKQDVAIIKTILTMKNICPKELALNKEK